MTTFAENTAVLSRIAKGDQAGMRDFIDQYAGLVWSLVRRKIANSSDAEDLVQEIFTEIWKSAHRYNPSLGSEATFVAVITRRRIIDAIRKITRHAPKLPFDGSVEYDAPAPSTTTELPYDLNQALQVMSNLRPDRRGVLELSVIHGRSHAQIVESTGMPLGTVKAHIRRGLEEIRTAIRSQESHKISRTSDTSEGGQR